MRPLEESWTLSLLVQDSASQDDLDSWTEDEDEEIDTTAEQLQRGRDIQGIPWDRLQFTREHYRETRCA